jgi:DNA-binding transcriptional regulator YiaG
MMNHVETKETVSPQVGKQDNVSFMRLVDDVTETVIPQSDFALAVGASERTVQNWSSGQTRPRGETVKRVLDLVYLVGELREVYTDEGIHIWLQSRNRNLSGQRPLDLLSAGQIDEVLEEVQRVVGGM